MSALFPCCPSKLLNQHAQKVGHTNRTRRERMAASVTAVAVDDGITKEQELKQTTVVQLTEEQELKRARAEVWLWRWNLAMGCMHLLWAIICLAMGLGSGRAAQFKVKAITSYPTWGDFGPQPATQLRYLVPFTALTSGFAWMSAAAHFLVLAKFPIYLRDLRNGINQFRWFEYAASSSLMIVLIAMLFGVWDVQTLFQLGSVNACMNFFGYSHEVQNTVGKKVDWSNFIFGCFAGLVPWCTVISYAADGNATSDGIPAFVWAILVVYIFFFLMFPLNMVLQYAQIGAWYRDEAAGFPGGGYYFGEKVYQVLSLSAKTLLLWLVVGGTNQPNAYTQ
mmetsp:Transcript_35119/g.63286  ORF Transcript_35119/g.63286 Transcript_35119/m.63286 type:complete len:336 (+) Transcript_35119:134-1141(+)